MIMRILRKILEILLLCLVPDRSERTHPGAVLRKHIAHQHSTVRVLHDLVLAEIGNGTAGAE